jgi:hypothetical protein
MKDAAAAEDREEPSSPLTLSFLLLDPATKSALGLVGLLKVIC